MFPTKWFLLFSLPSGATSLQLFIAEQHKGHQTFQISPLMPVF